MSDMTTDTKLRLSRIWNRTILLGTLTMTYLTVAKEKVMYQNERHNWRVLVYVLSSHYYYPLLWLNLALLVAVAVSHRRRCRFPKAILAAFLIFALNVVLFSANNVLNVLEGKPLHGRHQGIGW